jgi:hypothetical protein
MAARLMSRMISAAGGGGWGTQGGESSDCTGDICVDLHAEDPLDVLPGDVISLPDGGVDGARLGVEERGEPEHRLGGHEGGAVVTVLSELRLQDVGILREGEHARAQQEAIVGSVGVDHGEEMSLRDGVVRGRSRGGGGGRGEDLGDIIDMSDEDVHVSQGRHLSQKDLAGKVSRGARVGGEHGALDKGGVHSAQFKSLILRKRLVEIPSSSLSKELALSVSIDGDLGVVRHGPVIFIEGMLRVTPLAIANSNKGRGDYHSLWSWISCGSCS